MKRSTRKILSVLIPFFIIAAVVVLVGVVYQRSRVNDNEAVEEIKKIPSIKDNSEPTQEEIDEARNQLLEVVNEDPEENTASSNLVTEENVAEKINEIKPGQENIDTDREDLLKILNNN